MNPKEKNIAEIALPLPINKLLHYSIPEKLKLEAECGKRVLVSVGKRKIIGYIVNFVDKTEQKNLKGILKVLDKNSLFDGELMKITQWMADYYFCWWGEGIHTAVPFKLIGQGVKKDISGLVSQESLSNTFESTPFILTLEQQRNLNMIKESINKNESKIFLLHSVEGSGKTELYIQSIRCALDNKKQVIFLVPEISLIKRNLMKIESRFKSQKIAVFHSQMPEIQRYNVWLNIKNGEVDVVIGTRSAIFVPFNRLGLIVITDESDISYKQEQKPMYHTHKIALKRAEYNKATVILGSACPSIQTYYKAQTGIYELLELSQPTDGKTLSPVKIVDMKEEIMRKNRGTFSRVLRNAIQERISKKEQVIIFLNRRGYANFAVCKRCGLLLKCSKCDVALSYHLDVHQLQCHYCGYIKRFRGKDNLCPECKSPFINYIGKGTQKIELEIKRLFPQIRTTRLDIDTLKKQSIDKIVSRFNKGGADVLIGTQIITRCFYLPRVSLIGIILIDTILNIPDFHSAEYTYTLESQLVDLAHRSALPVETIIQTYNPSHYAIVSLKEHNYKEFYNTEISFRRELQYPPFSSVVNIIMRGKDENRVSKVADELGKILMSKSSDMKSKISILGPSPAPFFKLRGFYRWQILIKAQDEDLLHNLIKETIFTEKKFSKGIKVSIDVDPMETS